VSHTRAAPAVVLAVLSLLISLPAAAVAAPSRAAPSPTSFADGAEPPIPTTEAGAVATDRVIVRWHDADRAPGLERARGLRRLADLGLPGAAVVATDGRPVAELLAGLRADANVVYAEPDYVVQLTDEGLTAAITTNDPLLSDQYSLARMRVRDAWSVETGGSGVIAVLDTGVQASHPDLTGRLVAGYDFVNGDANAADDNGHGTWVSGIIAARANDNYGIAGISWSDKILPVKIMDANGSGYTSWLTSGITWAANHGATVINMSVGGFPNSPYVQDAIDYAWSKGVVLVGAAGNNHVEETFFPASFNHVISVSATQADDEITYWSSYGPRVTVSAPGGSVMTTNCEKARTATCRYSGDHIVISGTSFAAPNVAGVVALIRARYPGQSNQWIVDRLVATVDDLGYRGWDKRYGHGRVNALRAVGGTASSPSFPPADGYEANNSFASRRRLSLGSVHQPSIYPAGDVDYFAFDVPRAGRINLSVGAVVDTSRLPKSSLPINPVVDLFDASGRLVARANAEDPAATEVLTARAPGTTSFAVRVANVFANGNRAPYTIRAVFVDDVSPSVRGLRPTPGSSMLPASTPFSFTMSEPVTGVDSSSVRLTDPSGATIDAAVGYDPATRRAVVRPRAPLPTATIIRLSLTAAIRDLAGNPIARSGWTFTTAPGLAYAPWRTVTLLAGSQTGYRVAADGTIHATLTATLPRASGASVGQRATLPNLPGRWLHVENGIFAGTWLPESRRAALAGTTELTPLPAGTRILFTSGSHMGYRFDASGHVIASRTATLASASGALTDAVSVVNGRRHHRVMSGIWAGYWLPETSRSHRAGVVDRVELTPARRILLDAGSYTGIAIDASGRTLSTTTATLSRASGTLTTAWAVVNGRARYLVSEGIWAGTWLSADAARLER
jgi:subtilisin family serine protease